ncbi:hypothetical protein EMCRGX_G012165 [Ephydatia muelleri]
MLNVPLVEIVIQFLNTKLRLLYTAMASFRILVVSRVHGRLLHRPPSGIEESKLNPGKQKYKPCGKIKDDIGLGACSAPQEGRSKCDLNLKPGVTAGTASNTDSRYCEIEAIIDHYMNDEVRMEETGDIEAESGGVDPDVAEDHDEFDLGDMW